MANDDHPRLIIPNFLSLAECKELEFIHQSCGAVGYRPNVFSTTLSHLIATNCGHFLMPFVPIRERLKEKVEEFFGCEFELFIEFTGLISWCKGASIGWHSDDNRPYLRQRDFSAVCYLNNHGEDFNGGLFHFKDSEPETLIPMAGDLVAYTADSRNIHSVDEITDGERLTLTLWFTRDNSHDEDAKLISFLTQNHLTCSLHPSFLPSPASSKMYWFPPDESSGYQSKGFDIRFARLHTLGFGLFCHMGQRNISESDPSDDFMERLNDPLMITRENNMFDKEFLNISHILQASNLQGEEKNVENPNVLVVPLSQLQIDKVNMLKHTFLKDEELAKALFSFKFIANWQQFPLGSAQFGAAVDEWELYCIKLCKELSTSLSHWRRHGSIFSVADSCRD
ncbi:uncharacterized protein LOC124935927 isoform X2 [Impatiens glandulifera]|uniref:uncharacterized protein LOC124935927 isoform X2 n=1 Tax=Impatiens glandulifera TaxID=253017 RepID=UPI001FB056F0|nr:uncharacterized protein LOC124935927 isoform X2 [Impatiens glandulifera]